MSIKFRRALSKGRDYLFEPRTLLVNLETEGGVVAHIINAEVFMMQVRNALLSAVTIPRQMRLGKIREYEEKECFLITLSKVTLIVRSSWKRIVATATLATVEAMKTSVLPSIEHTMVNGVIIY